MARSAQARQQAPVNDIADRVAALDWGRIAAELDAFGCATTGPLLGAEECAAIAARYDEDAIYRSRVIMGRHGFGRGEYKYFAYPLPDTVAALRASLYPRLAQVANRWNEQMGLEQRFPDDHAAYVGRCHAAELWWPSRRHPGLSFPRPAHSRHEHGSARRDSPRARRKPRILTEFLTSGHMTSLYSISK